MKERVHKIEKRKSFKKLHLLFLMRVILKIDEMISKIRTAEINSLNRGIKYHHSLINNHVIKNNLY